MAFAMLFSTVTFAGELVVSPSLKVTYTEPKLISHSSETLILKYEDWYFSHSLINPQTMYSSIDLSGLELEFVKSIFSPQLRETQPAWLAALSTEQAETFGLPTNKVIEKTLGTATIYAVYIADESMGHIFVIEEEQAHQLTMLGKKERFSELMSAIKER